MLLKNIKLDENFKMSSPVYETTENDVLVEPDQLIHGNDDAKSNRLIQKVMIQRK